MKKTILLTGATDGIGFETAKKLVLDGHTLLIHGRNANKLAEIRNSLAELNSTAIIQTFLADLSKLSEVKHLANLVQQQHSHIDVLINNAGVFKTNSPTTDAGYDVRFIVNTLAPYVLTLQLLPNFNTGGRVINLSSAAQAPVSLAALKGQQFLSDSAAYAQSKLAITMWTRQLAASVGNDGPAFIAINPASLLGSKMVKQAYGSQGKDLKIGADILFRAALTDEFNGKSGMYFDNDIGDWSPPHPDALNEVKNNALISTMQEVINHIG